MHIDLIRRLDANLLLTLSALLAELNVTRAAKQLGIQQSAMSARLARLREIFDDRLFIAAPDGRGVLPTPRVLALAGDITKVIALLDNMVGTTSGFDASTTNRTFTLALHEIPAIMLAPDLVPGIAFLAPSARLSFISPPKQDALAEQMEQGGIDLYIGNQNLVQPAWHTRRLFEDKFLTAQRKGHPRGMEPLDIESYCTSPHLLVSAEGGGFFGQVDTALAELGLERRVVLSIQNYALAPIMVATSDYLCTLPSRFLQRFEGTLDLFEPPVALGAVSLSAYWHPRVHEDPAHRWLREQLFSTKPCSC
jgi:DNA-binding transcriptional LysR family regulator